MLDPNLKAQVATALERLQGPVELVLSLDDSPAAGELAGLVDQLVALSPRLSRREAKLSRAPSLGLARPGEAPRVTFAGVPGGHEFSSLVIALLQVSGLPPRVEAAQAEAIRALPPMELETWVSLSCHNCPEVVQALNTLAVLNPGIRHQMVDGAVFAAEAEARRLMGVPAVFRGDELVATGLSSLPELLAVLGASLQADLSGRDTYDVLVVGGGPAGGAAAIYAARKGLRVGLVAERFGGQVGDTLGIENFISVAYTEGPKLVAAMASHVRQYGVDVIAGERATRLVPGVAHRLELAGGASLSARAVVLAPGARWRTLGVPGEDEYRTRGVAYCPHCDGPLFKGKRVAVIGGGNSGVEAAIDLAGVVSQVTLLEYDHQLRADKVLEDKLRSLPNVDIKLSSETTEVTGDGQRVTGLRWRDRSTGGESELPLAGIFVQIGLVPQAEWLRGTLALSPRGEIIVDERGATSVPGVYAAGDATTVPFKQIIIAMGDGAKASLGAFEYLVRTPSPRGAENFAAAPAS